MFYQGITNKQLDGVIAYYCTKGIDYQELILVITDLLVEIPYQTSLIVCGLVLYVSNSVVCTQKTIAVAIVLVAYSSIFCNFS